MKGTYKQIKRIMRLGICCLLLHTGAVYGQQSDLLLGQVIDADSRKPIIGCIISYYRQDSSIIDYTISDGAGRWDLLLSDDGRDGYVECKILGYESGIYELSTHDGSKKEVLIELSVSSETIEDILVRAQRIGIQQKGDTIDYDLKSYTTGEEETLGDVLETLPGMEVSDQGDIKYNGSRVDVLLMEEKDILNNQHKLATEGLRADDIADVQIIENYKSPDVKTKKQSDKVAMNVELTDEAKARWRGALSAGVGYEDKIVADASIFNINDIWSTTVFGRYNNTGEALMSVNDYLSMQVSMISMLNQNKDNLDNLLPSHFLIPTDLSSNSDALIAANIHKEKANKLSTKLSVHGIDLNRNRGYEFDRTYQTSGSSYVGMTDVSTDHQALQLHYRDLWSLSNQRGILRVDIPISGYHEQSYESIVARFERNDVLSNNDFDKGQYSMAPMLKYSHDLADHWVYTVEGGTMVKKENEDLKVSDVSSLYDTDLSELSQSIDRSHISGQLAAAMEYSEGRHAARAGISTRREREDIETLSSEPLFTQGDASQSSSWSPQLFYRYESDRWIFEPTWRLSTHQIAYDQEDYSLTTHRYDQLLRYSFHRLHFILLRYHNGVELPAFSSYQRPTLIEDQLTLSNSSINPDDKIRSQGVNLSYLNYQVGSGRRWHILFSYAHQENQIYQKIINRGSFIEYQRGLGEYSKSYSLRTSAYQPLWRKSWSLRANVHVSSSTQYLSENDFLDQRSMTTSAALQSKIKSSLINGSLKLEYALNETDQGLQVIQYSRIRVPMNVMISTGALKMDIDGVYTRSSIQGGAKAIFWDLGAKLIYQISPKYHIDLVGRDLLNLNRAMDINATVTNFYFQENKFQRFPGYITLSIRHSL